MIICPECKGNGFTRIHWEAEEVILQCETCKSQGELNSIKQGSSSGIKGFKDWTLD
tara:strand:- start:2 stop:169 length:168 start_codon:yes stop_codon:yes gene_type:complete